MLNFRRLKDSAPQILLLLIAVAFSIKGLREPDLWWQIRTGEWILENLQVPKQDIFSYTYAGAPWINVKWLSEILFAVCTKFFGPESVFLIQAIVSGLIVLLFFQISRLFLGEKQRISFSLGLAVLATLVGIEYRIIGRPEMFSHLLATAFLFLLLRHEKVKGDKQIFWLIPLQMFWANLHEAFGMGIVLTGIFVAGGWLSFLLSHRGVLSPKAEKPTMLTFLLVVQIAATVINPNGVNLLLQPFKIFGQVFDNKYTTELFDFRSPEYWTWVSYWTIGALGISLIGNWLLLRIEKSKSHPFQLLAQKFGCSYFILLIAFAYLALTAYRNIAFFVLMMFPFLLSGIEGFVAKWKGKALEKKVEIVFVLTLAVFYGLIVSNVYYKATNSRDQFGLAVLEDYNPVSSAEFIETNSIQGKCFSDYLTSSYLLWKLQPDFKTFIDLRDLDVFPSSFFNSFAEAVTFPEEFIRLDSVQRFEYIVLYRPQFTALHSYLYSDSRFKMAHQDEVAVVYVPKEMKLSGDRKKSISQSVLSKVINFALNPFYSYTEQGKQANLAITTASYFLSVGDLARTEETLANSNADYQILQLKAELNYKYALQATNTATYDSTSAKLQKSRDEYFAEASSLYRQSLFLNDHYAPSHLGLGAVYFQQQNYTAALESFEKAIASDNKNLNAYLFAAECCKVFVNRNNSESSDYAKQAIDFLLKAEKLNPDNPPMMMNIGFLYFRLNDCNRAVKYLDRIKNFDGFGPQEKQGILDCLKKCNP